MSAKLLQGVDEPSPEQVGRPLPQRLQLLRLASAFVIAAAGVAAAGALAATTAPGEKGAQVIYRSTMSDGRVVLSDRPIASARRQEVSTYVTTTETTASARRAMEERDYWRGRAAEFDQRQRERDAALDARRREQLEYELLRQRAAAYPPDYYFRGAGAWYPHRYPGMPFPAGGWMQRPGPGGPGSLVPPVPFPGPGAAGNFNPGFGGGAGFVWSRR